jgi:hypothetical protein
MSADEVGEPKRAFPWQAAGLLTAVTLAAVLRFAGLGFGLRHKPHWDETVFVSSVSRMLAAGDWDHRFYEYPGLFCYLLAPVLACLAPERRESAEAYLLARGLVAAFGVASVALAWRLGRRLAGHWGALTAALLVAVSPVEVITAHTIRPDVVLETFVLAALLAFASLEGTRVSELRAGVALGAATAVKFSGALLGPAYLVAWWSAPGRRLAGMALGAAAAILVFFLATPYGLLHAREFLGGIAVQWGAHYGGAEPVGGLSFGEVVSYYAATILRALGPVGTALLALGVASASRRPRVYGPCLMQVVVTLLVFSTASRRYERFLVPVLGLLAVLAGEGVRLVAARSRAWAGTAVLAATLWPLFVSLGYVRVVTEPGTRDLVLDWVEAHVPDRARVVNAVPELGLDPGRIEVVDATGSDSLDRQLASDADYAIWVGEPRALLGLERLFLAAPQDPESGPGIGVYRAPAALRRPLRAVSLARAQLRASSSASDLPALVDGSLETEWTSAEPQRPGQWLELELPESVTLVRVDLLLGPKPLRYGRNLHLLVADGLPGAPEVDGLPQVSKAGTASDWTRVRVAAGRPPVEMQGSAGEGPSQRLWIEPRRVRALRIAQEGTSDRRWGIAELRLWTSSDATPAPPEK